MFSGLGSGVGGTPQPVAAPTSGAQTPSRNSPMVEDGDLEHSGRRAKVDGNRAKRMNDDEAGMGSESGDGTHTPSGSAPEGKRAKLGHAAHHHHHHPHL